MAIGSRVRPIVGQTADGTGATYIVVDGWDDTNIQCVANGTVTFTVDSTVQNIMYDATALNAVNMNSALDTTRYVAPTSAVWTNQIASGSVSVNGQVNTPVFAYRINITAGTGSVTYHIKQG